jgi:antitoxin component YwqK of YwqJK toxin-antitoxin module
MIKNLSEVSKVSSFLKDWNGKNSRTVPTSNSKVVEYFQSGKDSRVNVVLIKQLKKYDPETYEKVLKEGVSIEYQSMEIEVSLIDKDIIGKVFLKNGIQSGEVLIKNKKIKETKKVTNFDAHHVFWALIED